MLKSAAHWRPDRAFGEPKIATRGFSRRSRNWWTSSSRSEMYCSTVTDDRERAWSYDLPAPR